MNIKFVNGWFIIRSNNDIKIKYGTIEAK